MQRLVNISSSQYDKAEVLAFLHAIAGPILVAVISYIVYKSLSAFIIAWTIYTFVMVFLNVTRLILNKHSALDKYKSYKYLEYLKYIVIVSGTCNGCAKQMAVAC